jgi:pSer/pThr/pTyr-binding forkhead associated (FHA) protein
MVRFREMEHLTGTRIRREATPATVNLRRCKLVVIKGAQRGTEFVISGDVIRIGKAPENDLVLADETVSRVHFEIVRDAKGYLVRDLKSTNGTFLDSAEVKEAYLRAGSVIAIGATELKFTPFDERIEMLPSEQEALREMVGKYLPTPGWSVRVAHSGSRTTSRGLPSTRKWTR